MIRPQRKISTTGKIFLIIMLVILFGSLYLIYRQHENDFKIKHTRQAPKLSSLTQAEKQTLTYILNRPFPVMGSSYQLFFETPQTAANPPETDYLTAESSGQVISDVDSMCHRYSFATKKPNGGFDLVKEAQDYALTTIQCYDANNSWSFNIETAVALTYSEYTESNGLGTNVLNGHLPANLGSDGLSFKIWVDVRSLGTPTFNCNDHEVCYSTNTSTVLN